MKKYIKYFIPLIIIVILFLFIYNMNKLKEYSKNFFYMDTYINVKIYAKNSSKAADTFDKVDKLYSKYDSLTDVYDKNSLIYYINNNSDNVEEIKVDEEIYKMLELSLLWYEKSNGKFNVNLRNVIEIWNNYRKNNNGLPSISELSIAMQGTNEIVLLEENKIKNNNPSIDLGAIVKGYVSQMVSDMLKDNGVDNFIISAGGNIVVGEAYNKDYFKIGIESPIIENDIYQIVKGNNISVVTSGGYKRFYEYDGIKYHHIIDPDTLYPANNMQSVTVIAKDSALADILSTTLFLLPVEDGIELVNDLEDVEAIFFVDENNIVKTEGFSKYE